MKRPTLRTATAILLSIAFFFFIYFVVDLLLLADLPGAAEVDGVINVVAMGLALLILALDLSEPAEAPRSWPTGWPRNRRLRLVVVAILFLLIGLALWQLAFMLLYEFVRIAALLFFIYHAGQARYRLAGIAVTLVAVALIIASSFAMDNQGFLTAQDFLFGLGALVLAWRHWTAETVKDTGNPYSVARS